MTFKDRVIQLRRNLRAAGFTAEASRLEHRLTHPDQLASVSTLRNRDLKGFAIQENERDIILIGWAQAEGPLCAHLLRRNRAPFLVCDEDEVYARKAARSGKMSSRRASSSAGHATSMRLPTDLRDLLRAEADRTGASVSSIMVTIIADHYRARRQYD